MSARATAWAWEQRHVRGAQKLLLLALADCCNAFTGLAFPSVDELIDMTGQDRKTVLANLQRLSALEPAILRDTGKKIGKTQQIKVWRLNVPREDSGGKIGTVKGSQKRMAKGPNFPSEASQIWDTEPSIEPSKGTSLDDSGETDLFGQPIKSPEQLEAERKAAVVKGIEEGWAALCEAVPSVAPLRGGRLDDARIETALQRAHKFMAAGETEADVWKEIFDQIPRSHFLCGEVPPREGSDRPFKLQMTWLLENRNFTKIVEGKYDDGRNPTAPAGSPQPRRSPGRDVAARAVERALTRHQRSQSDGDRSRAYGR